MQLILSEEVDKWFLNQPDIFTQIMALEGEAYRVAQGRETLRFVKNNRAYFIKKHFGVGWREFWKNIFQLRLPVVSAERECLAIQKLKQLGIPTMNLVGFGERGFNPLKKESFIITEELENTEGLRDICMNWSHNPLDFKAKLALIKEVARIARTLHENGVNHRDLYMAHFLLDKTAFPKLYVIDLHRAQIRNRVPMRWIIKDLSALYYSARSVLTKRDTLRFLCEYFASPWREVVESKQNLLDKVAKKAGGLREEDEPIIEKRSWRRFFVCHKDSCSEKIQGLLQNPDDFIARGELLTGEDTCTVARVKVAGKDLVIKRYNKKSFWHGINRLFRPSRAARCWRNAKLLLSYKIATPKPIAMLEKRFGPLRSTAYFVTEYVAGPTALDYFRSKQDLAKAKQLVNILRKLQQLNIKHGDTKASNFILASDNIYLVDLDGMRKYSSCGYKRKNAFAKDKVRFMKNWRDHSLASKLFAELYDNFREK